MREESSSSGSEPSRENGKQSGLGKTMHQERDWDSRDMYEWMAQNPYMGK